MAIYLVDYENVYIDGLKGMEHLTEQDKLHIFYTQNRCGLTFGLYEQLIHCQAQVQLNEVAVSLKNNDPVKNALDIQLMMFAGYLIGTRQSDMVCIVSKDKDFLLGTEFYNRFIRDEGITLKIVPSIEAATVPGTEMVPETVPELPTEETVWHVEEAEVIPESLSQSFAALCELYAKPKEEKPAPAALPEKVEEAPRFTVQYINTVRNILGKSSDEATVNRMCEIISSSKSLVDFNNALVQYYHDGQRTKAVYHKFKPRFENLQHLARVRRK